MHELLHAVNLPASPRIVVAGDLFLDHYIKGDVSRISPEAPIPVLAVSGEEYKLGGAANVAANAVSMGGRVTLIGVLGRDDTAADFRHIASALPGLTLAAVTVSNRPTALKTRMVARHQQMLRVDVERTHALPKEVYAGLRAALTKALKTADLLILSDYAKGVLSDAFTRTAIAAARAANVPVLVDPKGRDYSKYAGATAITPNRGEAEAATGISCDSDESVKRCARAIMKQCKLDAVLITLGADGVAVLARDTAKRPSTLTRIPTVARSAFDVTGAGDTFIATLGVFMAQGLCVTDAATLANTAAGIKVERFGAAAINRDELRRRIYAAHEAFDHHAKIVPREDVAAIAHTLRREGRRVVFTNGCFDILHAGHVTYLHWCKARGDVLVLGLNSDASVRAIKGPNRPVNGQDDRARVLAALADVDFIVIFEDERALEKLIRAVQPNVLVKGADWEGKTVVGGEFVRRGGGLVEFAPLLKGRSTTGMIEKFQASGPKNAGGKRR